MDYIGQLVTPMVTDQVLEIGWCNPYQTIDLDCSETALFDQATHRLLTRVQNLRHLGYSV
jgi:hypothetical protein